MKNEIKKVTSSSETRLEYIWLNECDLSYQDISKNNNNSNKTETGIRNVHTVSEIRSFS